ncbi:acyl-CoA dehydrogenase family protein [Variovorax sp. J31P207]|uniref:acyl-CoA dehydrogenase family protein n=1 Tax=Variovorax sp. J31P207 TaxID=3053510 RepID=UPI002575A990|nr:acyl-CoA dehydrogenase family protein [Variovorax sp. J31P207]MDM0071416.1 acyl-CoA dehydrogenase family protein [Variovorax sp. J31P207]
MEEIYTDALRGILSDNCNPTVVRAIEAGGSAEGLWEAVESSGFADVLLTEEDGGAGLSLIQAFELIEMCGAFVVPVPLAETMVARALIAQTGQPRPGGSVALATGRYMPDGELVCDAVTCGRTANWVLVATGNTSAVLLPADAAVQGEAVAKLDARLAWPTAVQRTGAEVRLTANLRELHASVLAVQLAGALGEVFTRTLAFANERQQFGRQIGKFQAIQHQLSVIAEHVSAARMAAQLGCSGDRPDPLRIAVAKARTGEAALEVAALSHSIHGAIGFTEEFDLQLFTRRLHAWRQAAGSEAWWQDVLGAALLDRPDRLSLELIRATTDASSSVALAIMKEHT